MRTNVVQKVFTCRRRAAPRFCLAIRLCDTVIHQQLSILLKALVHAPNGLIWGGLKCTVDEEEQGLFWLVAELFTQKIKDILKGCICSEFELLLLQFWCVSNSFEQNHDFVILDVCSR